MRITDRLKAEHGVFLRQLKTLERLQQEGAPAVALAAVVASIADAEEHHSALEDRVLYPALVRVLGPEKVALQGVAREHARLRALSSAILSGRFEAQDVADYVQAAREHFEHEIHGVFVLAEEWISDETLEGMANWNVDHTYEELGRPAPWKEKGRP
jgi:hemerythrin-like domain-containing protein